MSSAKKTKGSKAPKPAKKVFDESALSKLTAKIESNLTPSKPAPEVAQHTGKRKRADAPEVSESRQKAPKTSKKSSQDKEPPSLSPPKTNGASKANGSSLLEEIRLLGGDEEDLALVAGVDSDAEEGQSNKTKEAGDDTDKALRGDLSKFAASLGFDKVRSEAYEGDNDESELVDEVEEEEEDEVEEERTVEAAPAPKKSEVKKLETKEPKHKEPKPKDSRQPEAQEVEAPPVATDNGPEPLKSRSGSKLIFEPRPDWHTDASNDLPTPAEDDIRNFSASIYALKSYAESLLETDAAAYSKALAKSSTHKFMSTIMSSGTMSDKVSALTLAVQESPVHNKKALDSLMGLAGKNNRTQAIAALAALVDLLGNGVILPNDRRLRTFQSQPGLLATLQQSTKPTWQSGDYLPGKLTDAHLIAWSFEDWLKDAYFKVIQLLERWSHDEIENSRSRALDFVFGLLRAKPEQEANLLRLMVNKLGDRDKKIASRASYLLLQLTTLHPGMKKVVITAVENEVLLRPGANLRTKYYAINTLNQTILTNKQPEVADSLVRIYFELFASLLKTGTMGLINSETPAPVSKGRPDGRKGKKERPAPASENPDIDTAERLVSGILTGVNRAIPFSNTDDSTLEAHLDTLFKITHSSNFNTAIQALMLVQQLSIAKYIAVDRFYRTLYESLLDPRLITSSKQALYLNLLYKALTNDVDIRRLKAFVKRMLQVTHLHQAPFVCGILFLVSELQATSPTLRTLLTEPEQQDEDLEEIYRDAPEEGAALAAAKPVDGGHVQKLTYDGRKRDPQYSNADQTCLWELTPYFHYFHPSVSVFADNILAPQSGLPKPELANHTLIHFLDRFVYRNAKVTDGKKGNSIMQPVMAAGAAANVVTPGKAGAKEQPTVNSAAFWNLKRDKVAAEDVFFHAYFAQVGKPGQATNGKKSKKAASAAADGVDDGMGEEDENEDEIWDALVKSRPEVGGEDSDDGEGFDMDDDESDLGSLLDMSDDDDDSISDDEDMSGGGADLDDEDDGWVNGKDLNGGDEDAESEEELDPAKKAAKEKKERRKKMKKLPMFATAEDYAAMLDDETGLS